VGSGPAGDRATTHLSIIRRENYNPGVPYPPVQRLDGPAREAAAVAFFLALAAFVTRPLVADLSGSMFPGPDPLIFGWAFPYLQQWLWWASHSRLEPFKQFARMIREHIAGIMAWTRLRISNGALEGMNNKVKVISHRAYGFRKTDTFITAIWHGCDELPLG
jgi:hypothetical protein